MYGICTTNQPTCTYDTYHTCFRPSSAKETKGNKDWSVGGMLWTRRA